MKSSIFFSLILLAACIGQTRTDQPRVITPGADQLEAYLPLIQDKKVAVTVNHSSLVGDIHLTDTLLKSGVDLIKVFTPEHGFTGTVSDGAIIEYDENSSAFELISLYGKNKKPSLEQLDGIDLMLFDIQDVGARFYTYISTMHYVMEACAEANVPVIILDRPNPNGSYVDGPVLDTAMRSFVGLHPIPIVHGMSIGELAQMINDEGWLRNEVKCDLTIVKTKNWTHATPYSLPVKPSPNLPDDLSIALYPSLCLFEGTIMSVGRGTDYAFQQIGHPEYPDKEFSFTPVSREGAKWPPYEDQLCYGISFSGRYPDYSFTLNYLIEAYHKMDRDDFFNDYFKRLAGTEQLQQQIESGMNESEIRATWQEDLEKFSAIRTKYLLYK